MGNFDRGSRDSGRSGGGFSRGGFGGGKSFGGGSRFGGRSDGPREMHQATCSQCGQDCEIPFRPSGDRPVFCNNCFKSQGGPSQRFAPKSFSGNRDRGMSTGGSANVSAGGTVTKAQFDALNVKVDKILSMLTTNKIAESPKAPLIAIQEKKEILKKEKVLVKKTKAKKK